MNTDKINELLSLNVNEWTEKKNNLTFLSWANAWREFLKIYPGATYEIVKDEKGLPYFGSEVMGYMVYTNVTADGLTRSMWLPVMDGANKPMKDKSYTYKVAKYEWNNATRKKEKVGEEEKAVEAINMFDVNKTVMRCLTKNLAMFGLGLYIYAGEDLPEDITEAETKIDPNALVTVEQAKELQQLAFEKWGSDHATEMLKVITGYEKFGRVKAIEFHSTLKALREAK